MAKKGKHIELEDSNMDRDELALLLQEELNKKASDKVSYFLDEDDNPVQITEWVSTGSTMLDLAISNRAHGGLPVGKIIELSGLEGTGKSLFCAQIIAETQKRNGLSVFFDSEFAVDREYWKVMGVNVKNVNYVPFTTIEEFFNKLEICIGAFRKANKDRLLTIFVDSIAQASTEVEMEAEHGKDGYNTSKSIIISKAMRKITGLISKQRILVVFTNQLRYNMQAGPHGDKWVVPGGKALPFACSVRVRLQNHGKIKNSKKEVIGMQCYAQVIKNRCGPNYRSAEFDIMFDSGIQDYASWLYYMKMHGLIKGDGRGYTFTRNDGTELKLKTEDFVDLLNKDESFKEEVYTKICDNYIMKYKQPNSAIFEEDQIQRSSEDDEPVAIISENE